MDAMGPVKAGPPTMEQIFERALFNLKEKHPGDTSLVIFLQDKFVAQAVLAWDGVDRQIIPEKHSVSDPWDMIWYSRIQWLEAAGVPKKMHKQIEKIIIHNNLVYPDGTKPDAVKAYLLTWGRELLGLAPPT